MQLAVAKERGYLNINGYCVLMYSSNLAAFNHMVSCSLWEVSKATDRILFNYSVLSAVLSQAKIFFG